MKIQETHPENERETPNDWSERNDDGQVNVSTDDGSHRVEDGEHS